MINNQVKDMPSHTIYHLANEQVGACRITIDLVLN